MVVVLERKLIVGLDLSMTKTGVAVMDIDGNIISTKLIKPKASLSHGDKLQEYYNNFTTLSIMPVVVIGIEQGITRFNKSTQAIFRVHGVANLSFRDKRQEYVNIKEVKKFFAGNGNASKEMMINEVKKRYALDLSDDEADAVAVAEFTRIKYLKENKI